MAPITELLPLGLALVLLALGLFCLLTRRRLIKQVIGLCVMLQGALLILVDAGQATDQMALAQGMVVSALLVETVGLAIVLALVVNVYRYHPEGLIDDLDLLKG